MHNDSELKSNLLNIVLYALARMEYSSLSTLDVVYFRSTERG